MNNLLGDITVGNDEGALIHHISDHLAGDTKQIFLQLRKPLNELIAETGRIPEPKWGGG